MTANATVQPAVKSEEDPAGARRPRRFPKNLPAIAAVSGGTAAIGWHASLYGNWLVDDAAITFAYARSFADGLGPVVAPGAEPVEGFSNPTWTALLAAGRLLGLFDHGTLFGIPDYVLLPKALALLFCGGILAACHVAARKITRRPWLATLVIGLALASIPSFVIWCFSGLENSLFALTVTWLAVILFRAVLETRLLSREVAVLAGALAAFAALTRPDGLIYVAAYPLVLLIHLRRSTRRSSGRHTMLSLAAFAVPFGAYLTWRYLEFGRFVANTAVAKGQNVPGPQDLFRVGDLVFYAGALLVLVLVVSVGMALSRSWWRGGLVTLLVPLGLGALAYAAMEQDWMGQYRFATPVWVLAALAGTLATAEVLRRARTRGRALLSATLLIALIPSGAAYAGTVEEFRDRPTIPMCYIADRFGRVFNQYADILGLEHASLLEPDLGGSSMTSRLNIVDMAGLADSKIADFHHSHDMAGLRNYVFDEVKPTFVHSRGPWGPSNGISRDPRLARDYYPIFRYGVGDGPVGDGDWVRKDVVTSQEKLQAVRDYASATVLDVEHRLDGWPRRHCGPTLRTGQTNINQS